tara:strand:+ start:613 stop:849 length:237 start_codon:yes stop_codon:yes gene_type:complete
MGEYTKLSKPSEKTYAIIWGPVGAWYGGLFGQRGELKCYAEIETNQSLHTKWVEIDYYTERTEWKTVLLNNGIDPDEE